MQAESISHQIAATYPTLNPTPVPTAVPTPLPSPSPCDYEFLTCGATVTGNNHYKANSVGVPHPSGEANYLVLVQEPTRLSFTTCSENTNFDT